MGMKLYTTQEAADILRVSRSHIRKMIKTKELPATKVGREYRITISSLMKYFVAEQASQASDE